MAKGSGSGSGRTQSAGGREARSRPEPAPARADLDYSNAVSYDDEESRMGFTYEAQDNLRRMPMSDQLAVYYYQRHDFANINGGLRSGRDDSMTSRQRSMVNDLDIALSKAPPVEEAFIAYRGGRSDLRQQFEGLSRGDVYTEPGFSSTSINRSLVRDRYVGGNGVEIRLRVPRGSRRGMGLPPTPGSGVDEENEFLIRRGSRYRIRSVYDPPSGPMVVEADLLED